MTRFLRFIPALAAALLMLHAPAGAQTLADYHEFYRLMRINAAEQLVLCYPATAPGTEPNVIGVLRDSLGRPTQLTRFRFGNADAKSDWTTMRISYSFYQSINTNVEQRTFFNPGGTPISLGPVYAEEVYRRGNGELIQRKIVDRAGKPVDDVAGVHRAMFKQPEPGTLLEEWYISTGKLHYGTGSDGSMRPFAVLPPQTYYREFEIDAQGNLLHEVALDLDRKPIPYPGGEIAHAYELNDCGQPTKMKFLNAEGKTMTDADGIAWITFAYDDFGRMIGWRSFGANGSPKGRKPDGVAAMKLTYRAFDGVMVAHEKFDAKGHPIAD